RDQRVLERRPRGMVHVDVARRHAPDAEPLREAGEPAVAGAVPSPQGSLELDPEPVAAEGPRQSSSQLLGGSRVGGAQPPARTPEATGERPVASAAREADEALCPPLERGQGK